MDIQAYIASGILESYCLSCLAEDENAAVEKMCLLYPEIKEELASIELALQKYAEANAVSPAYDVKHKLLGIIADIDKEACMIEGELPLISKFSDHKKWLAYVDNILPEIEKAGLNSTLLRHADGVMQALVVSTEDINNEVHTNELESFLILKGECECRVGNEVFRLKEGGYASIPLHQDHNVKVLSPYVVAILQHVEL